MYDYTITRPRLFTDEGQRQFLEIRDKTFRLLKLSGAVRLQEIIINITGDSWTMIACLDRMVELGEIAEIPQGAHTMGQLRIFIAAREL